MRIEVHDLSFPDEDPRRVRTFSSSPMDIETVAKLISETPSYVYDKIATARVWNPNADFIAFQVPTHPHRPSDEPKKKWEYNFIHFPTNMDGTSNNLTIMGELNKAGEIGWELAGPLLENNFGFTFIMKREK